MPISTLYIFIRVRTFRGCPCKWCVQRKRSRMLVAGALVGGVRVPRNSPKLGVSAPRSMCSLLIPRSHYRRRVQPKRHRYPPQSCICLELLGPVTPVPFFFFSLALSSTLHIHNLRIAPWLYEMSRHALRVPLGSLWRTAPSRAVPCLAARATISGSTRSSVRRAYSSTTLDSQSQVLSCLYLPSLVSLPYA